MSADRLRIGDVVTAIFPEHHPAGHEQQGARPAVVVGLTERLGTARFPVVVLVPLTSDRGQAWAAASPRLYPRLPAGIAGLRAPSLVLLDQVRALGLERVRAFRGALGGDHLARIADGIGLLVEP